jgi:serine/threonine protein kinase/Tol biopolymer transport system component
MSLSTGSQIGRYRIVELLGAGGMGEVYRGRDSKLNRDVALKVLPPGVAADRDRLGRFEREAQIVASLNHPNIAHVHGFEEAGEVSALAMELVEGPTLADRIAQGALAPADALPIARQIAEALEAAHEHGIVHRDLKPANVKVRPDGTVKVLDFGLAKAIEPTNSQTSRASMSPTLSIQATQAGIILGTAGYMSPEQAAGKSVDKRADLWAFGVVLLEMLTGRTVFEGETVSHVLAAVLKDEPRWNALPPDTAPAIQRLLRRCLQKDPRRRLDSAATARLEIDDAIANPQPATPVDVGQRSRSTWIPWAVALLAIVVASALAIPLLSRPMASPPLKTVFSIPLAPQLSGFAVSPDGTQLVFSAPADGRQQLFLRKLDEFAITAIPGADGGAWPFWSPDSRTVGFFAQGKLRKIELATGRAQTLCDADVPPIPGAAWSPNGTIVFVTAGGSLMRVSANGGPPAPVETAPGDSGGGSGRPQFLPDGERFIFYKDSPPEARGMYVSTLGRSERTRLTGQRATFAPPDHLLIVTQAGLVAQRFDLATGEPTGEPRTLTDDVPPAASASDNGVLVYRRVQSFSSYQLGLVDRSGKRIAAVGERGDYYMPRVSPDGTKLAVERHNDRGFGDLEIVDLVRDAATRFTFKPTKHNAAPTWSPTGDRLAYHSLQGAGPDGMFVKPANGLTEERLVLEEGSPTDWTAGEIIVIERRTSRFGSDLWQLALNGKSEPRPLLSTRALEQQGRVSPNGKWLAYVSDESGEREVYVTQFPPAGGKWQLSTAGGDTPVWGRNGAELFFVAGDGALMAVPVRLESVFEHDKPVALFTWPLRRTSNTSFWFYDALPDGKRFVGVLPIGEVPTAELNVIVNWQ